MGSAMFRSTAPARLPALLWSTVFILMAAPAFFSEVWWRWLLVLPCLAISGVLLISILFPVLFLKGIRHVPGGFELRLPLRRPARIQYDAITRIDAVVVRDSEWGFACVDLIISTARRRVRISESLLRESSLIPELKQLPGFDAEAYEIAEHYEPFGWTAAYPKRFRVLSRATPSTA